MKSALYEQVLQREGVEFTYMERLDLNAIDTKAGLANQARLREPIREDLISQYAELYKQDSDGPAIVVWKRKNVNRWVPIDGNQRVAAAKRAKLKTVDAYIVDWAGDEMVLNRLTWSFNNQVNGERISPEEILDHAVSYASKYGVDASTAAKHFGAKAWEVKRRLSANKMRTILHQRNASNAAKLSDDKLEDLRPLANLGEDIFTLAASTAQLCGLSNPDIKALNEEVKKAKTLDDKVKAVTAFSQSDLVKQRKAQTKGGTIKVTQNGLLPSERLYKQFLSLQRLFEEYDKVALRRQGVGYKEQHELVAEVVNRAILTFGLGGIVGKEVS